jgi:hypothetical protein
MAMSTSQRDGLVVGERLPALTLGAVAGPAVDLGQGRHSSVVVFPHARCDDCLVYLLRLDALAGDLTVWGGRPLAVLLEEAEARGLARQLSFPVLLDDGRARNRAGLQPDRAAVFVADRFGTVYRSDRTGWDHHFPGDREIVDEVRFIGIQCPECGVPDEPPRGPESWTR